jgi:hypothetical protein
MPKDLIDPSTRRQSLHYLWLPAQLGLGLCGIAQELLHLSGPIKLGVHFNPKKQLKNPAMLKKN